jgi:hypothetical protein
MIKTMVAYTSELDDASVAVDEIKTGLNYEGKLQKNTIGVVACHYEFIYTDVYKAICESLPFEVVGAIASQLSAAGTTDTFLLTITVLTSDDVEFKSVITRSLLDDPKKAVADSYISSVGNKKPSLILTYVPYIVQNCSDDYVNALTEASKGVPCFGTVAVDDTLEFSHSFVLANGEYYRDQMAMILIYGDISPKFFVAGISESRVIDVKGALVTKSAGSIVVELNERPVLDYFSGLGLVQASKTQYAMTSLPFLLDFNDGTPKVLRFFVMLSEQQHAICAGAMPEGSTMYIASADADDVMLTTGEVLAHMKNELDGVSIIFTYTCVGRAMVLGSDQFKEMELISEVIGEEVPYMSALSGGEICPTEILTDKSINRCHNNTFVACMF